MGGKKSYSLPSLAGVGVTIGYFSGRPVIENLSFELNGSGVVRLDAPNGVGKTTLIEAASGYLKPESGKILVNGQDAHEPSVRSIRRVLRATPALHPNLSLVDHLGLSADLAGVSRDEPLLRAEKFGLSEWFGTRTSDLSTGTARKLWYIICTTGRFDVALLDEPFNGVDKDSVEQMIAEITDWARSSLVVFVSHSIPEALKIDEILELKSGTKVWSCPDISQN